MNAVRPSKYVEKAAGRIAGHVNPLRHKLTPGDELANHKQNAKSGRREPQSPEAQNKALREPLSRLLQGKAAGDQHNRVEPQDPWQMYWSPIAAAAFPN